MTQKKVFRALFIVLAAAFVLFPSCKTTEPAPAPVSKQYTAIEAKAPANQVDVLLFNDFHGNVAEDTRPGKGRNAGMAKLLGYMHTAQMENPNTIQGLRKAVFICFTIRFLRMKSC